jgi:hypothetical protein
MSSPMFNLPDKEVITVLLTGHSYFGQIGHYHFGITDILLKNVKPK